MLESLKRVGLASATFACVVVAFIPCADPAWRLLLVASVIPFVLLAVRSATMAAVVVAASFVWLLFLPNVHCYSCKSRQSEAKTNLSGIFTAEKAFFGMHGRYTADLHELPWLPDGSPLYLYGFTTSGSAATTTADPRLTGFSRAKMKTLHGRDLVPADLPPSFVTTTGFRAFAVGDIGSDYVEDLDVWSIDETKQLRNTSNDCAQ